jgi:hypothetical protein
LRLRAGKAAKPTARELGLCTGTVREGRRLFPRRLFRSVGQTSAAANNHNHVQQNVQLPRRPSAVSHATVGSSTSTNNDDQACRTEFGTKR